MDHLVVALADDDPRVDTGAAHSEDPRVQPSIQAPRSVVERIVAHEDRLAEAASEVFVFPEGRVIRQADFPHVFDANVVRHPRLVVEGLDRALSRLSGPLRAIGARHMQLVCDEQALDERVQAGLRARGFVGERLLAMVLPGRPARGAEPRVELRQVGVDAPFAWYVEAMDLMSRDEPWYSPAVAREIVGSLEAKAAAGAMTLFVARLDGRNVGAVGLGVHLDRGDDERGDATGTGAILTVGTVPEARHRGVAQSMVVRLAERARDAGCDLIYLVARADDTPKQMYRKFGFEVVCAMRAWLRSP